MERLWIRLGTRMDWVAAKVQVQVNRTIWMLWLQGWDGAPEIVRACVASWRAQNPGWDLRLLTAADVPALLGPIETLRAVEGKDLPPEAYSNLVRLGLLRRFGGVWADATTYCLRPLDEWIDAASASGFFGFAQPGPDRMLSSWFLAARPENPLLAIWERYCAEYWATRSERHIYFWFHGHLFTEAYEHEPEFRRIWDATPKISADGPHQFIPYDIELGRDLDEAGLAAIDNALTPLLKLTHKVDTAPFGPQSAYRFLVDRALGQAATPG